MNFNWAWRNPDFELYQLKQLAALGDISALLKLAEYYLWHKNFALSYDYAVEAFVQGGGHRNCLGNNPRCPGRIICDDDGITQYIYICLPESAKEAHNFLEIVREAWSQEPE